MSRVDLQVSLAVGCVCVCAYVCGVGRVSVCWGGRARQCVALWHAQVVVRGWCVWPCECVGVGGGWFVCGVGLLCIGATRARVGRMGVCVWGAPVGAGRQRQRPRETARQRTTLCVCGCGVKGPACGRGVCVVWAAWVCVCVCGVRLWVQGQRQRPRDTARQRTTKCVCVEFVEGMLQDALCDGGGLCVRVLSIGLCMCVSCVVCVSKVCVECVPGMYCVGVTV